MTRGDALLIAGIVAWAMAGGLAYGAIQLLRFSVGHEAQALYSALAGFLAFVSAIVGRSCIRAGIRANNAAGD